MIFYSKDVTHFCVYANEKRVEGVPQQQRKNIDKNPLISF